VFDMSGKELPSQIRATSRYERELTFRADHVPSLGYKLFELRQQLPRQHPTTLSITPSSIENEFFRIEVDRETGWLKSIVDKRNGRELLVGPGNELHLLADYPKAWDAWNIGLTGVKYPSKFRKAEIVEEGPARAVLRLYRDYLKPGVQKEYPTEEFPSSFFTQEIILYAGVDQIYFKTDVDWWEEKTMLKVAFPLTVSDTVATYEIPYGTIRRSTQLRNSWEKAKVEVPAQRWADLSQNDYGVSLLNKAKYGYDIKGDTIRLSLLRSPKWPDPTADRGKHSIDYALYPHAKRWTEANTVRRGYEYNNPLLAVVTNGHNGQLPESYSFINLEPENLVLTTVKKAEDSDAWVVQWYDAKGQDVEAELTLPKVPKKVVRTNFLEEDREALPFSRNTVRLRTSKNAVVTAKIFF
jgi:alpha-mannosidase